MSPLTPYLCFADTRAAIDWYVRVFDATVTLEPIVMDDDGVGHAEIDLLGNRLMMSDAYPSAGVAPPDPGRGNAISLHLEVTDVDALTAAAVEAGATLDRGPEDAGDVGRVAVLHDPFGHRWFLNQPA